MLSPLSIYSKLNTHNKSGCLNRDTWIFISRIFNSMCSSPEEVLTKKVGVLKKMLFWANFLFTGVNSPWPLMWQALAHPPVHEWSEISCLRQIWISAAQTVGSSLQTAGQRLWLMATHGQSQHLMDLILVYFNICLYLYGYFICLHLFKSPEKLQELE